MAAPEAALKPLDNNFEDGWLAAELCEADTLTLYTTDGIPDATCLTNGDDAWLLTTDGGDATVVDLPDATMGDVVDATLEECTLTDAFDLRTPGRARVLETLGERFDPAVATAFETAVATVEPVSESAVRVYDLMILVGAAEELVQYHIGRWADDTRFGSSATVSRRKQHLEATGLIETSSVKREVGRPRHRLHLSGPLAECSGIEAVVETAAEEFRAE